MTLITSTAKQPDRLSVAPMMDWTDRHCRYFHRLLTRRALLYTEMVTTGALLHGDVPRHLRFNVEEHPLALQLGGSEPADLAQAAKLGEQWGYDEINLNCGCPSERVQRGAFGACLMAEPQLVADGVKAMLDVVSVPVTVNTVSPGYIGTDMVKSIRPDVLEKIVAGVPAKRLGTPEEIASIISWIASDEGGYATGADFSLNGGLHMG